MQDIFCEEEGPRQKPKKLYGKPYVPPPTDILSYLQENHVKLYGEKVRMYFSAENRNKIINRVSVVGIPYVHFISFIYREMMGMQIFTNMITGSEWPSRFRIYLETLNLPVEIEQLKSPYALPCWGEYQTFMGCLKSFVKSGQPITDLIKNFSYSHRISDLTLDYIYTSLELEDEELDHYFSESRLGRVLPFEDVQQDLTTILQNYES